MTEGLPACIKALAERATALVRELNLVMLPRDDAEAPESVKRFRAAEKQLRSLRRDVAIQARDVRAHFKAEGMKLSAPKPLTSLRDAIGRPNATERRLLREQLTLQREAAVEPLVELMAVLDRAADQARELRLHALQAFPPPVRIRKV